MGASTAPPRRLGASSDVTSSACPSSHQDLDIMDTHLFRTPPLTSDSMSGCFGASVLRPSQLTWCLFHSCPFPSTWCSFNCGHSSSACCILQEVFSSSRPDRILCSPILSAQTASSRLCDPTSRAMYYLLVEHVVKSNTYRDYKSYSAFENEMYPLTDRTTTSTSLFNSTSCPYRLAPRI